MYILRYLHDPQIRYRVQLQLNRVAGEVPLPSPRTT